MRQLTFQAPGKVEWRDAAEPKLAGPGEALVRPVAVTLCDLDTVVLKGKVPAEPGMQLGHEFIAEIVELGDDVRVPAAKRYIVPFQISCGECARCRRGLTASCEAVPELAMYGLSAFGGGDWGGALCDLIKVPFANSMLVPLPDGVPDTAAAIGDNFSDGYRCVAEPLRRLPGASVLVVGGSGASSIGLYACHIGKALGASEVSYVDRNPERLALAERLGCKAIEVSAFPRQLDPRAITVDASSLPDGLALALRSTEPGGECTVAGIYWKPTEVPMFDMYLKGVSLHVGRAHVRAVMPEVLGYLAGGLLDPSAIGVQQADWEDAPAALADPPTKLVLTRRRPGYAG
jgi:threonine dehydrogenase-like Zn-dependent dehydrogenase